MYTIHTASTYLVTVGLLRIPYPLLAGGVNSILISLEVR